jgi:uncharacterized low-complexity protein
MAAIYWYGTRIVSVVVERATAAAVATARAAQAMVADEIAVDDTDDTVTVATLAVATSVAEGACGTALEGV